MVAHSFGFAYSKGLLDYFNGIGIESSGEANTSKFASGNKFGNYYIVAPENAIGESDEKFQYLPTSDQQSITLDINLFDEVWQYGSNFNPVVEQNGDKKCKQDGVAAQTRVRGLTTNDINNVFIPETQEKIKRFVAAHLMENYGWILNEIFNSEAGYIKPRNY